MWGNKGKNICKKVLMIGCILGVMVSVLVGCEKDNKKNNGNTKELESGMDEIFMSVGDVSVSYKEALAYIYMLKKQYEPSMGKDIWDFKMEDGKTFEDYAKNEIVKQITQLKVIGQEAKRLEIALDEDEKLEAKATAKDFLKRVSKEDKKYYQLKESTMTLIMEEHLLAKKVYDIATNEVDTTISDEEAKQITLQYLVIMTKGTDKNGNKVDMSKEEKKIAKKKAKNLYKQAKEASSFYSLAESYTDAEKVEITFGKNEMPKYLEDIAFSLKKGEMSELIEGEDGYYILYCINDNDEDAAIAKKEEIIQEQQDKLFRKKFKKWAKKYNVIIGTKVWDKIELNKIKRR